MDPTPFYRFAAERHLIYLARRDGRPRPWTLDPILSYYKFTNVYRELDRTTIFFRRHLRDPLQHSPDVLLATVAFRWFNRIETWARLLEQMKPPEVAEIFSSEAGRECVAQIIRPHPPWVTGAYIIQTMTGCDKLEGVLRCIELFAASDWRKMAEAMLAGPPTRLQTLWGTLCKFPHMGPFMAYEVVSDLRHTDLLRRAPDILEWANAGPGAMRGLNRLHGRDLYFTKRSHDWSSEMRELLEMQADHWPCHPDFPPLEMREIEHTLCEFDKYERTRLGEGIPRGVYHPRDTLP